MSGDETKSPKKTQSMKQDSPDAYSIKPIEWKKERRAFTWFEYTFDTPFCGSYRILDQSADGMGIQWEFNFHDAFDSDSRPCSSVEEGMRLAKENWEERLKQCLTAIPKQ